MSTIIQNNKKQLITIILIIMLLPIMLYLSNVIFEFGKITGTAIRMYLEGICIK
jgi:hypothetical protein